MADWETFESCGEAAKSKARFVCIPFYPFVAFSPSERSLLQLADDSPTLRRLLEAGRVLTYNLVCTSSKGRLEGFPDVHLNHFSAEAVIDYLGKAGVARVVSLGVDGGVSYAATFSGLVGETLLASGQPTYDYQFAGIANALFRSPVEYSPLGLRCPIFATIKYERRFELAAKVLGYSIRRHAPSCVKVAFLEVKGRAGRADVRHGGVRFSLGARATMEFDCRSLVVGNLMPVLSRVFSTAIVGPRVVAWRSNQRCGSGHLDIRLDRLLVQRVVRFDRSSDFPWSNASAKSHDGWMAALREAIYWKCISIPEVRRQIARGNVSARIFDSMSRSGGGSRG